VHSPHLLPSCFHQKIWKEKDLFESLESKLAKNKKGAEEMTVARGVLKNKRQMKVMKMVKEVSMSYFF
jgi:hypothetical protein